MKFTIFSFRLVIVAALISAISTHIITPSSLSQTQTFGKTHFILGHRPPKHVEKKQELVTHSLLTPDGVIKHAFFSPDHNVRDVFIDLIAHEQESIKIAIYYFTDRPVAHALLEALERGISVEVITDQSCADSKHNKVCMLNERSVPIYVFDGKKTKNGSYSALMHNKFALFKKNIAGKSILWTGSFNLTRTAAMQNQENVVILEDKILFDKFDEHYTVLKGRCKPFVAPLMVAQNKKRRPIKMKKLKMEYMGGLPALTV